MTETITETTARAPSAEPELVGSFDHEMCRHCMTINDDMDAICMIRGNRIRGYRRCQQLPCPDFVHCDTGANSGIVSTSGDVEQ
jgi:hypothetical protein